MSMWKTCLLTIERVRAYAVRENRPDMAYLLIIHAAIFARMMVNTGVPVAEQWYVTWAKTRKLPAFHRKECLAILRWAAATDCVAFLQLTDWQQWRELQKIRGLGPAKAAMAVALMGGKLACIDRHVYAYFTVQDSHEVAAEYKREVTRGKYQALHRRFFGTDGSGRDKQWKLFERQVPSFAESGHMPYFESLLSLV